MAIVNAIVHAQRLGDDKVAAHHVNVRALQWRIVQTHGEASGNIQLQQTGGLFHQFKRFGIGHTGMFVIHRFVIMRSKIGINLRTCAIHYHQANTEAVE